jgi:hypothetical protein
MPSYMKDRFGAWQIGSDSTKGQVEFKIFFPNITADPSQYVTTNTTYTEKDNQDRDVTNSGHW